MTNFIAFALYLCFSAMVLIVWPIMLHPTLPMRRKIGIIIFTFLVLVPGGLGLYAWLGVPQMAAG